MLGVYRDYLCTLRNGLIREGVGLKINNLEDYSDIYYFGEQLTDVFWFFSVLAIANSRSRLRSFILKLDKRYYSEIRKILREEYLEQAQLLKEISPEGFLEKKKNSSMVNGMYFEEETSEVGDLDSTESTKEYEEESAIGSTEVTEEQKSPVSELVKQPAEEQSLEYVKLDIVDEDGWLTYAGKTDEEPESSNKAKSSNTVFYDDFDWGEEEEEEDEELEEDEKIEFPSLEDDEEDEDEEEEEVEFPEMSEEDDEEEEVDFPELSDDEEEDESIFPEMTDDDEEDEDVEFPELSSDEDEEDIFPEMSDDDEEEVDFPEMGDDEDEDVDFPEMSDDDDDVDFPEMSDDDDEEDVDFPQMDDDDDDVEFPGMLDDDDSTETTALTSIEDEKPTGVLREKSGSLDERVRKVEEDGLARGVEWAADRLVVAFKKGVNKGKQVLSKNPKETPNRRNPEIKSKSRKN